MTSPAENGTISIIGSGFAGTATVLNLLDRTPQGVRIAMVEPQTSVGRGVAYGTDHLSHLLNVPAERMSVYADRPEHFLDWFRSGAWTAARVSSCRGGSTGTTSATRSPRRRSEPTTGPT